MERSVNQSKAIVRQIGANQVHVSSRARVLRTIGTASLALVVLASVALMACSKKAELAILDSPKETMAGEPFNMQQDGSASFWGKATGLTKDTVLMWGPEKVQIAMSEGGFSAIIPAALYAKPGTVQVSLMDTISGKKSAEIAFRIDPRTDLQITSSPERSPAGKPFNAQPDGHSVWYAGAKGVTVTTVVMWGTTKLQSNAYPGSGVNAVVPAELLAKPGTATIYLLDTKTGKKSNTVHFILDPA
jgi:hypothetical protein